MNRVRLTFDGLASIARRRPVAVAGTVIAAIVVGGLLGAVVAGLSTPRAVGDTVTESTTPGSSIGTAGFGGDVASPTPTPAPSPRASLSATLHPTPSTSPVPPPSQTATPPPEGGYGGVTPSPTPLALDWRQIPDVPPPDGLWRVGRSLFELPTGELAMSGMFDDFSGAATPFIRVYDPEAREWRETTVEGLDPSRLGLPAAVSSDGRIFLMLRDVSGVNWLSITPVDTSSEPWVAGAEQVIVESGFPDPGSMKVAQIGDRLFIPEVDGSDATRFLVYDLETGEISRTAPTPGGRFLNLVADDTYLYAADDNPAVEGAARYDPTSDTWDGLVPDPPFGDPVYTYATATGEGRLWVPVMDSNGMQQLWTWDGSSGTWSQVETPDGFDLAEVRLLGTQAGELYMADARESGIFVATDLPE